MALDPAMIKAMEALAAIQRHEAVCAERWEQIRKDRSEDREKRDEQHGENSARLRAIEDAITSARGASRLAKWLWGGFGTVGGGVVTAVATKWLPAIFR